MDWMLPHRGHTDPTSLSLWPVAEWTVSHCHTKKSFPPNCIVLVPDLTLSVPILSKQLLLYHFFFSDPSLHLRLPYFFLPYMSTYGCFAPMWCFFPPTSQCPGIGPMLLVLNWCPAQIQASTSCSRSTKLVLWCQCLTEDVTASLIYFESYFLQLFQWTKQRNDGQIVVWC